VAGAGAKRGRVSRSADFDAAFRRGRSHSGRHLVVYALERPDPSATGDVPRLGLAVSRKVGNAVVRNQVKRQLREAFDRVVGELPTTTDFIVIARPSLPPAIETQGFEWLVAEVRQTAARSAGSAT
jgi:ribonuclease P protein component